MSEKFSQIQAACKSMHSFDFSIQLNEQDKLTAQDKKAYLDICEAVFQKWHTAPSMPTPSQLRTISEFANKHGFKVSLVLPPDFGGAYSFVWLSAI